MISVFFSFWLRRNNPLTSINIRIEFLDISVNENMLFYIKSVKYYLGAIIEIIHVILQAISHYLFSTTEKNIRNEIVLITGSGRGLGQQLALLFAKRGAIVILCDIDENGNTQTAELIAKEIPVTNEKRIFAYTCDIGNQEEIRELIEKIQRDVGDVTMLVNNGSFFSYKKKKIYKVLYDSI